MKIDNIISEKIDALLKSMVTLDNSSRDYLEEMDIIKNKLELIDKILSEVSNNIYFINNYSDEELQFLLGSYDFESLRFVRVTIDAINNGLPVELLDRDLLIINDIMSKLSLMKNELLEKYNNLVVRKQVSDDMYENSYLSCEELKSILGKIKDSENVELISSEEFQVLYTNIIEDEYLDYNTKRQLLIDIKRYNMKRSNSEKKKVSTVTFEDIKSLLEQYELESAIPKAKYYSSEIVKNIDIDKAKEVLDYLNTTYITSNVKLKNRFSNEAILTLMTYGTKYSIENRFEDLKSKLLLTDFFFDTPSAWIDNFKVDKKRAKRGSLVKEERRVDSLSYYAHMISYDEIMINYDFLKSIGVDVNLRKSSRNDKVLKTPNYRLVENFELFKLYGIYEEGKDIISSIFTSSRVIDKCDLFIELELLNGNNECSRLYSNAVKNYPSCISRFDKEHFAILALKKKNSTLKDYYNDLFSTSRTGMFKNEFTSKKFGYNFRNDEEYNKFLSDNFVIIDDEVLPNYSNYEDIMSNSDNRIDESVLLLPEINALENEYKISDYAYKFGNQVISRLKVLRVYSALQKEGVLLDKHVLMYALCKGSYIDQDTFNLISECINYKSEGMEI